MHAARAGRESGRPSECPSSNREIEMAEWHVVSALTVSPEFAATVEPATRHLQRLRATFEGRVLPARAG